MLRATRQGGYDPDLIDRRYIPYDQKYAEDEDDYYEEEGDDDEEDDEGAEMDEESAARMM